MSVGSIYFDGTSSQYLLGAVDSTLTLTGDFTIEFYFKCSTQSQQYPVIMSKNIAWSGTNDYYAINPFNTFAGTNLFTITKRGYGYMSGTLTMNDGVWHHLAIVRSGTTGTPNIRIYADGVLNNGVSGIGLFNNNADTWDYCGPTNSVSIGANLPDTGTSSLFNGYISNLRVVNGYSLYTAPFIPPTTNLTAITGTVLLLNMAYNAPFVDSSPNNFTITPYNSPTPQTDAPVVPLPSLPCFKEDSKILCLVDGVEKELLIQDIRNGVLVKTVLNGYVPVCMIERPK